MSSDDDVIDLTSHVSASLQEVKSRVVDLSSDVSVPIQSDYPHIIGTVVDLDSPSFMNPPATQPSSTHSTEVDVCEIISVTNERRANARSQPLRVIDIASVDQANALAPSPSTPSESPANFLKCPICLSSPLESPASTVCGHLMCYECGVQAIRHFHACPVCKRKLKNNQFHKIYI